MAKNNRFPSGPGSVVAATYLLGQGTFASDRSPSLASGANEALGTGRGGFLGDG